MLKIPAPSRSLHNVRLNAAMKACAPPSPRKSGTASAGSCPLFFLMTVLKSVCAAKTASVAAAAPVIQTIRFILIPQFEFQFHFGLSARKIGRQGRQLRVLYCAHRREVHSLDAATLRNLHIRDGSVAANGESHLTTDGEPADLAKLVGFQLRAMVSRMMLA